MIDHHTERLLKARDRADYILDKIEQLRDDREIEPTPDVSPMFQRPDRSLGAQFLTAMQRQRAHAQDGIDAEYRPRQDPEGVEVKERRVPGPVAGSVIGSSLGAAGGHLLDSIVQAQRQHNEQWLRDQLSRPEDPTGGLAAYLQGYKDGFRAAHQDDEGEGSGGEV